MKPDEIWIQDARMYGHVLMKLIWRDRKRDGQISILSASRDNTSAFLVR